MPRHRSRYPTDLTDAQWALVRPLLPRAKQGRTGRPRTYPLREIWNAIVYLARGGGRWRALPHDLPPWGDVWYHFRRWRDDGTLERVHGALREQVRVRAGKEPTPSAAIIDSQPVALRCRVAGQSVKTTEKGGSAGTTRGRRSPGASGMWSSIPLG